MQSQRALRVAAAADGDLAYAPPAPAAQGHIVALTSSAPDLFSTSAKNPRTHASFAIVEWKKIHFLSHKKCARAQDYQVPNF